MTPLPMLDTLLDLWTWAVKTQGTTHANAALQALPFYNTMKVWLEDNSVAPEDWIDQIWEYTWNDAISWQENFAQMTELRPKIGTIELATETVPDDSLQIDDIELVVNENQLAIAAVKADTVAIGTAVGAILGTGDTNIEDQLTTLRISLEDYANNSDNNLVQVIDAARGEIMTNANTQAGYEFTYHETEKGIALANLHAARDALATAIIDARNAVNEYTAVRTDTLDGTLAAQLADELAAIGQAVTDINAHTDDVRTSLNADVTTIGEIHRDAVLDGTYQQSIDVRDYVGNATDQAVLDLAGQMETVSDVTNVKVDEARLIIDAIDQRVVDLPATIKLDADAQTAWVLDNVADRIRPDGEAQRDYVVGQGEAQRDYVVSQVNDTVNQVGTRVDDMRLIVDAIDARVVALGEGMAHNGGAEPIAETTFEGVYLWDQAADYYVIGFFDIPPGRPLRPIGDELYAPHLAWCAFVHQGPFERGPQLEFSFNIAIPAKLRASGILVYSRPGTAGVIRAYNYQ